MTATEAKFISIAKGYGYKAENEKLYGQLVGDIQHRIVFSSFKNPTACIRMYGFLDTELKYCEAYRTGPIRVTASQFRNLIQIFLQ